MASVANSAVEVMVVGLAGSGLILLNNRVEQLAVDVAGAIRFAGELRDGEAYEVLVAVQPAAPDQMCNVTGGSGTIAAAATQVSVSCETVYGIGGTVVGLASSGLVLHNNGGDYLAVDAAATKFQFSK